MLIATKGSEREHGWGAAGKRPPPQLQLRDAQSASIRNGSMPADDCYSRRHTYVSDGIVQMIRSLTLS